MDTLAQIHPGSIPLPGTNISPNHQSQQVGPRNDEYHNVSIQVLRSSTMWSAGLAETENSIYRTYEHLIKNSQKYVYVENQFFVTAAGENKRVKNQIGRFLAERIVRAHQNREQFKIYVVIPCVPGMNGRLEENTAAGQEGIDSQIIEKCSPKFFPRIFSSENFRRKYGIFGRCFLQ